MPGTLHIITRPLHYLLIKHSAKKYFDWFIPIALSSVSVFCLVYVFEVWNGGMYGVIEELVGFVKILPGFYIAALAAIATFNGEHLDKTMPSPAPQIVVYVESEPQPIDLTRRRFLALQFSFLAAESFIICIVGLFYGPLFRFIRYELSGAPETVWLVGLIWIFFTLFWQLLVTTFLGLYYLGDKMHQPE